MNFPETIFLEEKVKLPQKVGGTKFKTKPGDGRRKMSSPCDGGRDEDQGLQSSEQHFLGGENYQWPNSWKTHLFKNFLNLAQILSRAGRDGPGSHTDRARHSCSGWSSSSLSLQYIDCHYRHHWSASSSSLVVIIVIINRHHPHVVLRTQLHGCKKSQFIMLIKNLSFSSTPPHLHGSFPCRLT